jgi:anti-anti-sigma factor
VTGSVPAQPSGPWPVVRLRGEIDLANVEELYRVAEGAVSNRDAGLVVDLSGVTFLDSTGLRLLFRLARRLGDRQQGLRLVVPEGARISKVLDFAGVGTVAEVLPTYDPDASDERGARA